MSQLAKLGRGLEIRQQYGHSFNFVVVMITLRLPGELSLTMEEACRVLRKEGGTVSSTYMVGAETKIDVEKKTKIK